MDKKVLFPMARPECKIFLNHWHSLDCKSAKRSLFSQMSEYLNTLRSPHCCLVETAEWHLLTSLTRRNLTERLLFELRVSW